MEENKVKKQKGGAPAPGAPPLDPPLCRLSWISLEGLMDCILVASPLLHKEGKVWSKTATLQNVISYATFGLHIV